MSLSQKIWTYQLNNSTLVINESFGLPIVSLTLVSGTGFFQGNAIANGIPSSPVDLQIGQPVTISSDGTTPIDEFTITTTGVVAIIGKP